MPRLLRDLARRWTFLLLTTLVLVFFSEKMYWYTAGYEMASLVLVYGAAAFVTLWCVEAFQARGWAALFLCGAVYGFIIEGVIVNVLYEDGLFGWFHVSYTSLGWHALFSVLLGWLGLRKLLVSGSWRSALAGSAAFGVFWGVWSLAFWLPEAMADPANEGQRVGPWPIEDFALYAFTFGGMVTLAELLFSAGAWRPRFRPSKVEGGLVLAFLGFWFIAGTAQTDPIAWLKLPAVMVPALWALWRQRDLNRASALAALSGASSPARALAVLAMPAAATLVFGLALWLQPPDAWIAAVSFWSVVGAQTAAGWLLFLAALAACIWKGAKLRRQRAEATAPVDPVPDAGR